MRNVEYPWHGVYHDAILELDHNKLGARIELALAEINSRKQRIALSSADDEERSAIEDALGNLRVLQREILSANK